MMTCQLLNLFFSILFSEITGGEAAVLFSQYSGGCVESSGSSSNK